MYKPERQNLIKLIVFTSVARMIVAAFLELGSDEVYYWTYAQKLQWNYFDHPPMVAVWIRIFTGNPALENYELFVRFGSITGAAIASLLIYNTVRILHSSKAGWYAAILYNASLYAGIIAGVMILPDSPQMLFWCLALFAMANISRNEHSWKYWILFGAAAGLCVMSKVHGAFLWIGLGIYILLARRQWLKLPQVYVAVLLTTCIAFPILLWNLQNDFITYKFHSERVTVNKFALNIKGFTREVVGEFFYNNPVNVILSFSALFFFRKKTIGPATRTYSFIALPMIAILLVVSIFRDTFPHWSGPAYISLIPLTAIFIAEQKKTRLLRISFFFTVFVMIAGVVLINFYPGTLGRKNHVEIGKGDFTVDMYGWREAGNEFIKLREKKIAEGKVSTGTPIVASKWFTAAHEDYYVAKPAGIEMIGLGYLHNLHHYGWMNTWRMNNEDIKTAWVIQPSNDYEDVCNQYGKYYLRADSAGIISNYRNGLEVRRFYVFIFSGWKNMKPEPVISTNGNR